MPPATIQKIEWIRPIENADAIELVGVLGWQCVVKKGEFNINDLVVYVEIDSIVPELPMYEFLRPRGFKVKTIKLRGELSQGLVLPLSVLPEEEIFLTEGADIIEYINADVSEILGITHYEKPIPIQMRGQVRGNFPTHLVPKTDEIRLQSVPEVINELKGEMVYSTVKLDGTSATFIYANGDYHVCSRNLSMKLVDDNADNIYIKMSEKYDIKNKLEQIGNIAVQGEIVGPGMQGNKLGLKELDMYIFNVYDIARRKYLDFEELKMFRDATGMKLVPIIEVFEFKHTIDELLEMAKGKYINTKNHREGIVIRPIKERYSEVINGRMSFKIINNEFLLKEKE